MLQLQITSQPVAPAPGGTPVALAGQAALPIPAGDETFDAVLQEALPGPLTAQDMVVGDAVLAAMPDDPGAGGDIAPPIELSGMAPAPPALPPVEPVSDHDRTVPPSSIAVALMGQAEGFGLSNVSLPGGVVAQAHVPKTAGAAQVPADLSEPATAMDAVAEPGAPGRPLVTEAGGLPSAAGQSGRLAAPDVPREGAAANLAVGSAPVAQAGPASLAGTDNPSLTHALAGSALPEPLSMAGRAPSYWSLRGGDDGARAAPRDHGGAPLPSLEVVRVGSGPAVPDDPAKVDLVAMAGTAIAEAEAEAVLRVEAAGPGAGALSGGVAPPATSPGTGATVPPGPAAPLPQTLVADLSAIITAEPDGPVELSLSPEELGRLKVSLWADMDGLRVMVQAERTETLDLLRRNADLLTEELRLAGFSGGSLDFSGWKDPESGPSGVPGTMPEGTATYAEPPPVPLRWSALHGLDLRF